MINLNCAELMSYNKTFNLWGNIFNYNSVSSYSINGRVSGDPTLSGIRYAWSGMSGLIDTSLAYQPFVINGVNLGTGKVTSLSFEEGNDIQFKKYVMSFEVFETGNLYNFTGTAYSEIANGIFDSNFPYFNDFQESIQISVGQNNIQETTQTMSFGIEDPVSLKSTARNKIFSGFAKYRIPNVGILSTFPNITTGNINSGYITYYNESYDLNSKYSFTKRSFYNNQSRATWEYAHSVDYNGADVVVTENGKINSIYFAGTGAYKNLSGARERWTTIESKIYERALQTYGALANFSGLFFSQTGCPLIEFPVDKRWQEDPFIGTIDYSYSYSNNPIYTTSGYIFSNSRQTSLDEDGYYVVTENGEYQGVSPNKTGRFTQASGGYYAGRSAVASRVSGTLLLATGLNESVCITSGNAYLINDSVTFEEFAGKVSYSNVYATSPNYYSGNSNFVKYTNSISDNRPVHLINKFLVPFVGEIAQSAEQSTEGAYSNTIEIFGKSGITVNQYLAEAFTRVIKPSGSGVFLKDMRYSYNPFENTFQATFDYSYSQYRSKNNILV